jgi:hypothetical protein
MSMRAPKTMLVAALAATRVACFASSARADEPAHARAALDYGGLATCPDRDAFASAVATRLGYDPFAGSEPDRKTLVVRFHREGAAISVTLRLDASEKKIASETGACDELGSAAAFAAAILLDPRAMFPRPSKPPPPGASLDTNAPGTWPWYEPPPTLPPPQPPPKPEPAPIRLRFGAAATGCAGCGPSPNAGGAVFFGIARDRLGLDAGARADLATTATAPTGREVSSSLVAGEVFPHARLGPARVGLLGSIGALFGDSRGETQTSLWAAAGARAGVEWMLAKPVFVRAALDGLVVVGRVSLRVDGSEVWSSPGFAAAASLGAGVEL